ncbi:hypothetical protein DES53_11785 [Roseimicrobium gellanilyticum]|uniref:Uncharacterized protein n=1 Tax=Roseimicrobium gellanilyticum TaxID=748857 RepID=A0A366H637_9BACT|nr:hypothetical protein DES53_11785 [Roseimicrobium gellanilyticum]
MLSRMWMYKVLIFSMKIRKKLEGDVEKCA